MLNFRYSLLMLFAEYCYRYMFPILFKQNGLICYDCIGYFLRLGTLKTLVNGTNILKPKVNLESHD